MTNCHRIPPDHPSPTHSGARASMRIPGIVQIAAAPDGETIAEDIRTQLSDAEAVAAGTCPTVLPQAHENAVLVFVLTVQALADPGIDAARSRLTVGLEPLRCAVGSGSDGGGGSARWWLESPGVDSCRGVGRMAGSLREGGVDGRGVAWRTGRAGRRCGVDRE